MGAVLALTACAKDPINLSSGFTPPGSAYRSGKLSHDAHAPDAGVCRVHLAGIQDERSDAGSMGMIGIRPVHGDTVAWLRSGLETLSRDERIEFVDDAAPRDLDLNVDLLKAYIMSITTDMTTNVVVRVHFTAAGSPAEEQVFRGVDTGGNWANGNGETQDSFDDALEDLLTALESDIERRCKTAAAVSGAQHAAVTSQQVP